MYFNPNIVYSNNHKNIYLGNASASLIIKIKNNPNNRYTLTLILDKDTSDRSQYLKHIKTKNGIHTNFTHKTYKICEIQYSI